MAEYALIAELDRHRAAVYRQVIEERGLETVFVRDGNAARGVLQTRGAPVLLITDLSLPRSDGFTLITDLRRLSSPEKTAVLVFSAFSELRAAASDLLISLGIAEVADKTLSVDAVRESVARALASLARGEAALPEEGGNPEELLHRFLHRAAQAFQVPIALVSVDLRQRRWFTAYVSATERLTTHDTPLQWDLLQQVASSRQPLVVPDAVTPFATASLVPQVLIRGLVAVPLLTSNGQLIGVLSLLDLKPLTLGPEQIDRLMDMVRPMADEFERRYAVERPPVELTAPARTEESWAALERLALTDSLTGLYNRHAGEQAIAREAARGRRIGSHLSLALLDLDNFKQVNDLHGHDAGDKVLIEVGRILNLSFRASDLAVRWGGDEFLILLPDVTLHGAASFAERARMQVEALSFTGIGRVTLSAGVVEVDRNEDPSAALRRADANLYEAKAGGRNRVVSAAKNTGSHLRTG